MKWAYIVLSTIAKWSDLADLCSISNRNMDAAICNDIIEIVHRYQQSSIVLDYYYNNFRYLITSQWRRADRHEPVVPVFLHCSHTKLAHETRPLGLEKEKEGCNCFRSYTRTHLIDHSANIWFSLWCSKKCLIPINRALLGRILLIASRDCKNETLVSCWGTYYYPPQETLDSLLRKSDLETSRQILRSTWKITSLRVKWVLKASPCSEHEVRVRLSTYLTAFAIQLYQIISKFVFSDGR